VAFKIRQNAVLVGASPRTLQRELMMLPGPPSQVERGHDSSTFSAHH